MSIEPIYGSVDKYAPETIYTVFIKISMFYLKVGVTITTQRKIESNAKFELSFSDNGFSFTGDCVSVDDNSINVAAIANDSYTCVKDLTKNSVLFNLGYPVDINFVPLVSLVLTLMSSLHCFVKRSNSLLNSNVKYAHYGRFLILKEINKEVN